MKREDVFLSVCREGGPSPALSDKGQHLPLLFVRGCVRHGNRVEGSRADNLPWLTWELFVFLALLVSETLT